jgi:hypothetical protein
MSIELNSGKKPASSDGANPRRQGAIAAVSSLQHCAPAEILATLKFREAAP